MREKKVQTPECVVYVFMATCTCLTWLPLGSQIPKFTVLFSGVLMVSIAGLLHFALHNSLNVWTCIFILFARWRMYLLRQLAIDFPIKYILVIALIAMLKKTQLH